MAPKITLYYFDLKGLGEPIRLLMTYAGIEFTDYRFTDRNDFMKMKENGELPFGQVPMIKVEDGDGAPQFISQSGAILRYLSRLAGLYPEDLVQAAQVDMALEQQADAFLGNLVLSYGPRFGFELEDDVAEKAKAMIDKEVLPRHLGNIEKLLAASPTGWLAGTEKPQACDFAWVGRLEGHMFNKLGFSERLAALTDFPKCRALIEKHNALPSVVAYYAK